MPSLGRVNSIMAARYSVWPLYAIGLAPAAWGFYLGATGRLGADPVKTFEIFLGLWAVRFLILTLAVTPLRDWTAANLVRYRRALGLLCFYYVLFHFAVYLTLDQELALPAIWEDIAKRPFIMLGMAGLALLTPLAATSNNWSMRRLRKNWTRLHKLIYVAAICGGVHFALSTKVLSEQQWLYLSLLTLLLAYRLVRPYLMRRRKPARRPTPRSAPEPARQSTRTMA
jgi:sulfoxide reductase heme-binding subunit YedZ